MLRKLLKHEYKATARFFLPVYGCFAILMVVQRLSMLWASTMTQQQGFLGILAGIALTLFSIASIIGLIALLACPIIYAAVRFYKNMLCDEGYLSFTLPVTPGQHLISKLLVSLSWQLLTILTVAVCGTLFFLTIDAEEVHKLFYTIGQGFRLFFNTRSGWGVLAIVLGVLAIFSQICENIMRVYNAMSIGQCSSGHKILASVAVYIAHNMLLGLLLQIPTALYLATDSLYTYLSSLATYTEHSQALCLFFSGALIANALLSLVYFFISRHFLTKKLNLA